MAGTGPTITVAGGRQLRATMRRAGVELTDLTDANRAVASTVATAAAPSTPRRTGRLAASVRPGATQTQAIVRAGGAALPYALPIHWGWPRRHITAQPWLSRAAQDTEPGWLPIYQTAIDRIIDKIRSA